MMSAKVAGTTSTAVRPTRAYTNPRDVTQRRSTNTAAGLVHSVEGSGAEALGPSAHFRATGHSRASVRECRCQAIAAVGHG
jgi:hypothetical protein